MLTGNHRREIDVVTNAQGDYLFTLQPLLSERGTLPWARVIQTFGLTAVQDEYDILGVKAQQWQLHHVEYDAGRHPKRQPAHHKCVRRGPRPR